VSPLVLHVLLLGGGIGVLYFGAEWLVRGAARMATSLGLSPIVVGLTVVSLGTSAPELAVCVLAALRGDPDIAMGNVMGSNLANIGLILGLAAVVRPLSVTARVVRREVPLMIGVTALLYPLILDQRLARPDGVLLLMVMAGYLTMVFKTAEAEDDAVLGEYQDFAERAEHLPDRLRARDVLLVLVGSGGLILGGSSIVEGAEYIALELGFPQLVISLSVIAIGTSLPELATSVVAALRDEADIAVGNIIGSNVFNLALILGTTAVVAPLDVNRAVLVAHMPAVLLVSLITFPIVRSGYRIRRGEGAIFLTVYAAAMFWLFRTGAL